MMMAWMELVEVSSCIMFEAAGDSEADSDISNYVYHLGISDNGACLNDDDDAMSCSYDDERRDMVPDRDNIKDKDEDEEKEAMDHENLYKKVYDDDDDDGDDAVNQILEPRRNTSGSVKREGTKTNKDFSVCFDSFMDDRDRDKLFWETCLAS